LLQKNINSILSPNQQNKTFIYNLRNYYNEKLSDEVENVTDMTETNPTVNKFQFYYSQYPNNIKFKAVSVDSQHTLWSPPNASTGKDYIKFIGKRYFEKYFSVYKAELLYWNYDLHEIVQTSIPKSQEQEKRDKTLNQKIEYCDNRLLCNNNIITDESIVQDWGEITNNRENRNIIANYVGNHCTYYKVPEGKTLIVNSESIKNGEKVVPQMYTNKNNATIKTNAFDLENSLGEAEGAAVGQLAKAKLLNTTCLVVSNDSDSLFFCLLA